MGVDEVSATGVDAPAAHVETTESEPNEVDALTTLPLHLPPWARQALRVLFLGFLAFALLVVGMGVVAAAGHYSPSLHERLHEWGLSTSVWGRTALRMADASHRTLSPAQLAIDYTFTAGNIAVALFLFKIRRND